MRPYDVLGVGGPILDLVLKVSEDYLSTIPGKKGGMEPVDYPTMVSIIEGSGSSPITTPGGSARNTLHGLARLGEKCALLGMIGSDDTGSKYRSLIKEQGIYPLLLESKTPSALVLSLVTPNGDRTMRTFQGASVEIRGEHLQPSFFEQARLLHLEGYTLFNDDLAKSAMALGQEAEAKISFDLSSFEVVKRFSSKIVDLIEPYVDILFANEEEAMALTGEGPEKACDWMAERCEVAVVLMGEKGCFVRRGNHKAHCPAYPVKPLDTTGAGDLFASGFLHGYLQGLSIEACAHFGAIAGRAVVQVMGAEIPHEAWATIYKNLKKEL